MNEASSAFYLSRGGAAARLAVSTRTIDRLRKEGELQWIRVGRTIRIDLHSMEAYEGRQRLYAATDTTRPVSRLPIPALDDTRIRR